MSATIESARGRWREILPPIGIAPTFLKNVHGPCPLCGGKDRFRFDDRDGTGSYICGQCGAGRGIDLVMKLNKWDFRTAACEIDKILGTIPERRSRPAVADQSQRKGDPRFLEVVLREANQPEIVNTYLRSRGLTVVPPVLLGHPGLAYFHDGSRANHPAMLAPVIGPNGVLQSVHRTYLADVPVRKKLFTPVMTIVGSAIRLFPTASVMGVAEGIETAIAAHELFGAPVWAAISAQNLEAFAPPEGVQRLLIFGDNDVSFTGQRAAYGLANRLYQRIQVKVHLPERLGSDWLDVLNERRAVA